MNGDRTAKEGQGPSFCQMKDEERGTGVGTGARRRLKRRNHDVGICRTKPIPPGRSLGRNALLQNR